MPLYESIVIVRPSLSDEETAKVVEKMKGVLDKSGATVLKCENWGKRKLAYEVKRERKGFFVFFNYQAPGTVVGALERSCRIEDAVIKFLTVRVDQHEQGPPAEEPKEAPGDGV